MTETMSSAGVAADADEGALHCYRHPDRETYVRCGRCDRPICTRCAMQGPVGFRCRQCGRLAYDPLTSIRPSQAVIAFLVAAGIAAVAGLVSMAIGWFGILIGFFAGGFIAEAVARAIGLKHGPVIMGLVLGGIVVGTIAGFALVGLGLLGGIEGAGLRTSGLVALLTSEGPWILIAAAAACAGAYSRMR